MKDIVKFDAHVDRSAGPDACWPWTGARSDRYGWLQWAGKPDRPHKVAYRLSGRAIPPGHIVHHTCLNPLCCNPAHLVAVSVAEHNRLHARQIARDRNRWARRLTAEQAAECRRYYRRGLYTSTELAVYYGICPQRVRHIGTDEPYREATA